MNKTIFVLGWDGYIGNALTQKLLFENYKVIGIDNYIKRKLVKDELKSFSALPILSVNKKIEEFKKLGDFTEIKLDISNNFDKIQSLIKKYNPSTIVNLAHNPSAPYSMISRETSRYVLENNILGINDLLWAIKNTKIHLINIGTTGEFDHHGNVDIEEGYFTFQSEGRQSSEMIFPRRPNSIYHASKVSMTYIIDYLCRVWNLKCTDIMQGIVVGSYTDEIDKTKIYSPLHSDEAFGTVLNRFIVQAKLQAPITIYGTGEHQRPFLCLNDSIQALMIAIKNDPIPGKARVWNQLSEWLPIFKLANLVKNETLSLSKTEYIKSPRNENTHENYYNFKTDILKDLGYVKTRELAEEIKYVYNLLDESKIKKLKFNCFPRIKFGE